MTFSYSQNPSSSLHDQVRFLLGDTDAAEVKVSDEEILFLLDEWTDPYAAAAAAADHLAATAASWMSYSSDNNSLNLSELQTKYMQLADALRGQGRRRNRPGIFAGGIDLGEKQSFATDDSVTPLSFAIGMHDDTDEGSSYGTFDPRDLTGGVR